MPISRAPSSPSTCPPTWRQLEAYDGHARPEGGVYDFANAAPQWNPLQSYRVSEKTTALYLQADLGGERWSADAGVRFVKTKTTAQAWDAQILSITENGAFNYTAEYADPTPISQNGDYDFVLPSANFTWRFTDDLQMRIGAAKTMARPPVDKLAPTNTTESVSWGEFTQVFGGNVNLQPYSAKQADISVEWYFAENSIFNVATFYKRIENQITTSWEPEPGHRRSWISVQHHPPDQSATTPRCMDSNWVCSTSGRTASASARNKTNNTSKSFVAGEERPLEGIAPSTYSLSAMYERGPWSIGTTADHTDGFVTAINVLGVGFNEEADPLTWLTAHASYRINDMFTVSLEGQNLLDDEQTYSINGNRLLSQGYYRYGRSVNLGVSVSSLEAPEAHAAFPAQQLDELSEHALTQRERV